MRTSLRQLFLGAAVACFFTLTLAALAQEKPAPTPEPTPATTAPSAEPAATPPAPPAAEAAPEAPKVDAPAAIPALRRIDAEPAAPTPPPAPKANRRSGSQRMRVEGLHVTSGNDNSLVSVGHDSFLAKDQQADAVVSVFGSSTAEGDVGDAVVSILGDTRATGQVGNSAVAVLGNTYVNNKVGDAVVAVLGDVELGPDAEIGGDVVSVGGIVRRDAKAIVHGHVQNVAIGGGGGTHFPRLQTWFRECLMLGRPLALARGLGFAWALAIGFFFLYVLIALIFRSGVDRCVTTLETRPGSSILTAILSILGVPVVIVLLCVTVLGIAAVPFLALALICAGLLGKTVMLAWVGRRITKFFGDGLFSHTAFAVLVGGVIVLVTYCVPFLGMLVQRSLDLLGFGVVILTVLLANKREKPTPSAPPSPGPMTPVAPVAPIASAPSPLVTSFTAPVAPVASASVPLVSPGFGAIGAVAGEPAAAPVAPPLSVEPPRAAPAAAVPSPDVLGTKFAPGISATTSPRAGFMIRLAALGLDVILWGIIAGILGLNPPILLLWLAIYGAVMWKLKGTTIGGVVCGLKIVRLDDREIDWATAIVRALGCFLSLAVVGLGFLWVAIDDDKQSWHDKIAGTTVVRVPKGTSLI